MTKIIKSLNKNNPFYFCISDFLKKKNSEELLSQVEEILSTQNKDNLRHLVQNIQTLW